jgi:hypothetical protein
MSISVPLVEGVVLALDRIGEHHECVFRHWFPPSRVLSQRDELTPLAPCGILLPASLGEFATVKEGRGYETLADIARSYNVNAARNSRLEP